jgi:hypothetical protein
MPGTGGDIVQASGAILSKTPHKMTLEAQLIRAHLRLQLATPNEDDSRTVTLMRRGAYEVRLVELSHASLVSRVLFWIELFDHHRRRSIDSAGSDILDDAVIAAEHLIAHAEKGEDPEEEA